MRVGEPSGHVEPEVARVFDELAAHFDVLDLILLEHLLPEHWLEHIVQLLLDVFQETRLAELRQKQTHNYEQQLSPGPATCMRIYFGACISSTGTGQD